MNSINICQAVKQKTDLFDIFFLKIDLRIVRLGFIVVYLFIF